MSIAVMKGLGFAGTKESCLRLGNVHIWVVPPCYVDDLLMFRNSVLNVKSVKLWAVPYCKKVHFRIVKNGIFRLRNVLIRGN